MTETTAVAKPADVAPKPPIEAGGTIQAMIPRNVDETYRLSQALAQAGDMVPRDFQGKPQAIMAAIIKGLEVGLAPMQALASIAVINGRPTIWGDAIPALIQRSEHHIDCVITGENDRRTATATLTRSNGQKIVRSFSVADAKLAKLWGKAGPWSQYPDRMLMMRARTFAVRDGAADALMGLQLREEVADYGPDHARDVTPRRGGVVYRDPEPLAPSTAIDPVDEILEHQSASPTDDFPGDRVLTPDEIEAGSREAQEFSRRQQNGG
jgi:hypothetical protein